MAKEYNIMIFCCFALYKAQARGKIKSVYKVFGDKMGLYKGYCGQVQGLILDY